jgi:hypothetical protein
MELLLGSSGPEMRTSSLIGEMLKLIVGVRPEWSNPESGGYDQLEPNGSQRAETDVILLLFPHSQEGSMKRECGGTGPDRLGLLNLPRHSLRSWLRGPFAIFSRQGCWRYVSASSSDPKEHVDGLPTSTQAMLLTGTWSHLKGVFLGLAGMSSWPSRRSWTEMLSVWTSAFRVPGLKVKLWR